jgi:type II secretory pathway pseudopilin PulG
MTLIELLIALTVLAIGISAIVAGYTSGVFASSRASKASIAASYADQNMETYRQSAYSTIPSPAASSICPTADTISTPPNPIPAGQTSNYTLSGSVCWTCPDTTHWTASSATNPPTCTPSSGQPAAQALKQVTFIVTDPHNNGKVLVTETSTFDSLAG